MRTIQTNPNRFLYLVILVALAVPTWAGIFSWSNNSSFFGTSPSNSLFVDEALLEKDLLIHAIISQEATSTFHLFSHGKPGHLFIEGQWLNADEITTWFKVNNALANKSHLNIYGCNFAQGEKGCKAIQYLEMSLGLTVAASNNLTGVDGDWELEVGYSKEQISLDDYNYNLQADVCVGTPETILRPGDALIACKADDTGVTMGIKKIQNFDSLYTAGVVGADVSSYNQNSTYMWTVDDLGGEVFSMTTDQDLNIYAVTTSLYNFGSLDTTSVLKIDGHNGQITTLHTFAELGAGAVIEYDSICNQLYVSNIADGKIYRIEPSTGNLLSTFDPLGADDGAEGFAPLGERILGLDFNYLEGRLYYAIWSNDAVANGTRNTIRSVSINSTTCDFTVSSDQEEIQLPYLNEQCGLSIQNYSMPVADIEFNSTGTTMLLGETGYFSGTIPRSAPHKASVYKYTKSGSSWALQNSTATGNNCGLFEIGVFGSNRINARGGVAFAYSGMSADGCTLEEEDWVLMTGDALSGVDCSISCTYGLQLTPISGGNSPNSVLLDGDSESSLAQDKSVYGDVDVIFGCNTLPYCLAELVEETRCGLAEGIVSASAYEGEPGYTFLWSDPSGQTTATATGLYPGEYSVTVTDDRGCTTVCYATVPLPGPPSVGISPPCDADESTITNGGGDRNGSEGTGKTEWTNVGNTVAADDGYTTIIDITTDTLSKLLEKTYKVRLPSTCATITSIQLVMEGYYTGDLPIFDKIIDLKTGGGKELALSTPIGAAWPTSDGQWIYEFVPAVSVADINSGLLLSYAIGTAAGTGTSSAFLDAVMLRVEYADPCEYCSEAVQVFSAISPDIVSNYQWNVSPGLTILNGQGTPNAMIDFDGVAPGFYDVCVTPENSCAVGEQHCYCVSITTCTETCPSISFMPNEAYLCDGGILDSLEVLINQGETQPDTIQFSYFNSPADSVSIWSGAGTSLGQVITNASSPNRASLTSLSLPTHSGGIGDDTLYIYSYWQPTPTDAMCRPIDSIQIVIKEDPLLVTIDAIQVSCREGVPNDDAAVQISQIIGGDKYGYSLGSLYLGPSYASASDTTGIDYPIILESGISNPSGSIDYTIRVFKSEDCYVDRTVTITEANCPVYDWGDLPDTGTGTTAGNYKTDSTNNGPSHQIIEGLYLGSTIDFENNGQQSVDAFGDGDDEDGLTFPSIMQIAPGGTMNIPFSATNTTGSTAHVEMWIDWNGDGDFVDAGEMVANLDDTTPFPNYLPIGVPISAIQNQAIGVRIRLSNTDDMTPYGEIDSGEVEDYLIQINCSDECVTISSEIELGTQ